MKACGSSYDRAGNPTLQSDHGQERAADAPAISVRSVSKEFHRPRERYTTLREHVLSPRRSARAHRRLQALDDVTFDVARGEFFGIIGRNGSGKSTLLRCLSQIYLPDRGFVRVDGRIAPLIELGVGLAAERIHEAAQVAVTGAAVGTIGEVFGGRWLERLAALFGEIALEQPVFLEVARAKDHG